MANAPALETRTAFNLLPVVTAPSDGVIVTDLDGLAIATVLARKGQAASLAARVREHFGIDLPRVNRRVPAGGDVAFIGAGPHAWLATSTGLGNSFALLLGETLGGLASVSDQSDGYAALRLAGPKVRETLGKLIPVDLHPRTFASGDSAATVAAHIDVTLWRLDDRVDGTPVFDIAVCRSLASSFWHALAVSAAEYGLVARGPTAP